MCGIGTVMWVALAATIFPDQNLPTLSSNIDTNDFEVFKFTAASIGGEQVTSLAYTLLDVY